MGWVNLKELVEDTRDLGQSRIYSFRKTPNQFYQRGNWYDLSAVPGNPSPNYYLSIPLTSDTVPPSYGLQHGGDVAPATKHLKEILIMAASSTGLPVTFILCDYLMFYTAIDEAESAPQVMTNSISLPRYADGEGVQLMAVMTANGAGTGATVDITYVNSKGATKTRSGIKFTGANSVGTVLTTQNQWGNNAGPFIDLVPGDTGIQSVTSVTMTVYDVGLFALVLVKPLATFKLVEQTAPVEVCFLRDRPSMPRIYDGAVLNLLHYPLGNISGTGMIGTITTCWG